MGHLLLATTKHPRYHLPPSRSLCVRVLAVPYLFRKKRVRWGAWVVTALRSAQRVTLGAGRGVSELSGGFVGGEGRRCVGVGFREGGEETGQGGG